MIISKSVYVAFASAISVAVLSLALVPQAVKADIALGLSSVEFEFGGQALSIRRAINDAPSMVRSPCQANTRKRIALVLNIASNRLLRQRV